MYKVQKHLLTSVLSLVMGHDERVRAKVGHRDAPASRNKKRMHFNFYFCDGTQNASMRLID